ncbi:MAG: gamma-glutamyltransferase [Acidobacteriota bacterium]
MKTVILILIVLSAGLGLLIAGTLMHDRPAPNIQQTRSEVMARNGIIATSQPLASAAGLKVLMEGGNAIDAAVTAVITLSVVEPMMTGPGGDLFALVWSAKDQKLYGLNASGPAGSLATLEYFKEKGYQTIPVEGLEPVSLPGAVEGWNQLLERFGTVPLSRALEPAIDYAEKGFAVSPVIAADWQVEVDKLRRHPTGASTYLVNGRAPQPGEIFKNPKLARTYRRLAKEPDSFYRGHLAEEIAGFIQSNGGLLTLQDFQNYHAQWVEPISTTYRGYEVFELPPNGQGIAALMMLNILEGFDLAGMEHNSGQYLHLLIEAKRLAFADLQAYVADPGRVDVPVSPLLSKEYAAQRRALIDPTRANPEIGPGLKLDGDTVYLTAADSQGNMISLINSIFHMWGSGVVAGETGVTLQNRGALHSLDASHPNRLEPGKRPFHTIIPAMVFRDGSPWLSFGVMGGSMQPQGHVQVLCNLIDFGMNIQQAGEAPRFRHESDGLALESEISGEAQRILVEKGHKVVFTVGAFGGFQGILREPVTGVYHSGSDPRKDGLAIGY